MVSESHGGYQYGNRLPLIPKLELQIRDIERNSMAAYASFLGVKYDDLIAHMCNNINERHADKENPGEWLGADGISLPLKTESDYWNYRRLDACQRADFAGELVQSAIERDLLHDMHIEPDGLRKSLSTVVQYDTTSLSISRLVASIPVVQLSEVSFNGIASGPSELLTVPHIQHYFYTLKTLQVVAHSLVNTVFSRMPQSNMLRLNPPDQVFSKDGQLDIDKTLTNVVRAIKKRSHDIPPSEIPSYFSEMSASNFEKRALGASISAGAKMLIWLHEIGHHLLGHLYSEGEAINNEREADLFALKCLSAGRKEVLPYLMAGAEIPFLVMLASLIPAGKDHPLPVERARLAFSMRCRVCDDLMNTVMFYTLLPMWFLHAREVGYSFERTKETLADPVIKVLMDRKAI